MTGNDNDNLGRYSYCFKFFEAGSPFKIIPVSLAMRDMKDGREYHTLMREGVELAEAHPQWMPPADLQALKASSANIRDRTQIAGNILSFIKDDEEVQIWSFHDTHCRHFFAELYGGIDQNSSFIQFRDKGINKLLPRDINHIYYGLGKPVLPQKPDGHEWNALHVARWQQQAFEYLRDRSMDWVVQSTPTDQTPPWNDRIFFDWEYFRESPFVLWPLSVGMVSEDSQRSLHLAIEEGLNAFEISPKKASIHHEWLRVNVLPKLEGVPVVKAQEATQRILDIMKPTQITEFWSDEDNHDRHLLGSLGANGKSFYRLAREKAGVGHILFRDTRHLRLRTGWPQVAARNAATAHNAFDDAHYCRSIFNQMNAFANTRGISPETIVPADFSPLPRAPSAARELSLLHP